MSKIKYIHFFGTSNTAGGGFEFDSKDEVKQKTKEFYSKYFNEELTQFNFSYPGQLSKLLNTKKIKVLNHGKSGFGNERLYRKTFEIVNSDNFNSNEHLFIFEFSYLGREEFYLKYLKDYVVFNYQCSKDGKFTGATTGYDYFIDSDEVNKKLDSFNSKLSELYEDSFDFEVRRNEMYQNNVFFLSFLNQNNIHYLFTHPPEHARIFKEIEKDVSYFNGFEEKCIHINDGYDDYYALGDFVYLGKYDITKETNGLIKDRHAGLNGNYIVAQNIYNKLIDLGYIENYSKISKIRTINSSLI